MSVFEGEKRLRTNWGVASAVRGRAMPGTSKSAGASHPCEIRQTEISQSRTEISQSQTEISQSQTGAPPVRDAVYLVATVTRG